MKKQKEASERVKRANATFAASAKKGASERDNQSKAGLVSFEGEKQTFANYLLVDFSVLVRKASNQKTVEGFEENLDRGLSFLRKKMAKGKSNFAIVPRDENDSEFKPIK